MANLPNEPQRPLFRHNSDLIKDSRLDTQFGEDGTRHTQYVSSRAAGQRRIRNVELWKRERRLGSGTYGTVWLESCHSGRRQGQFRAVKEIRKAPIMVSSLDYSRELEAVIKFSHEKVGRLTWVFCVHRGRADSFLV